MIWVDVRAAEVADQIGVVQALRVCLGRAHAEPDQNLIHSSAPKALVRVGAEKQRGQSSLAEEQSNMLRLDDLDAPGARHLPLHLAILRVHGHLERQTRARIDDARAIRG